MHQPRPPRMAGGPPGSYLNPPQLPSHLRPWETSHGGSSLWQGPRGIQGIQVQHARMLACWPPYAAQTIKGPPQPSSDFPALPLPSTMAFLNTGPCACVMGIVKAVTSEGGFNKLGSSSACPADPLAGDGHPITASGLVIPHQSEVSNADRIEWKHNLPLIDNDKIIASQDFSTQNVFGAK